MQKHKTKRIAIKMADVDAEMVPVVKWLNSFKSIFTTNCCQGNPKIQGDEPQIAFKQLYTDDIDMARIITSLERYAVVSVKVSMGKIYYLARFYNIHELRDFIIRKGLNA